MGRDRERLVGKRCWSCCEREEGRVGGATVLRRRRRVVEAALAPKNDRKVTHTEDEH